MSYYFSEEIENEDSMRLVTSSITSQRIDSCSNSYKYINEKDRYKRDLKLNEAFGVNDGLRHNSQWIYNELREKGESHQLSLDIVTIYLSNLAFFRIEENWKRRFR